MAVLKIPTNFNIDLEFEVPEFYRRLFAVIIDYVLLFFYVKIAIEILKALANGMDIWSTDGQYNLQWLSIVLIMGPVLLYHVLMEITLNGQSIGKKIMQIRVVNENGGKASISQFLIRWLLRDIWFLIILLIGLNKEYMGEKAESLFLIVAVMAYFITDIILVASSKKGQRIGDLLARTILIRTHTKGSISDTVFIEVADSYVPSFPQIMQLSDKDINAVKGILENARKRGDSYMAESAAARIKAHLKIESDLPPFDFLDVLLKDYNYLSTN
ncbi:MAG: RDD family protein [Chitinophagaceae bacterium]|nr:RDD family protein [Chitinophagaceae bacterium]